MMCRSCGLDGPCDYGGCEVRTTSVHHCASCGWSYGSDAAAKACAVEDADTRSIFTD